MSRRGDLLRMFSLRQDQDDPEVIDDTIRSNVAVAGTNLWVLFFAILIASIGLNVNSTAVIIGAMLISPLMGPIVGVGYGAGVRDLALIRLALRNLLIFAGIGLFTSTLYFLLTPLTDAQSELLARTSPNLWDVLIAFFGGAVGMIGATRRYTSNVVPGVAIATALMPPLCTAGYGIATGNLHYFGGAFYLFTINSVFIAFSSLLIVKLLRLPERARVEESTRFRTRMAVATVVLITAVPSAFLAVDLVQQKVFDQVAQRIIRGIDRDTRFVLLGKEVSAVDKRVMLTMGGEGRVDEVQHQVELQFESSGYTGVHVSVRQIGSERFDVTQLTQELKQSVLTNTLDELKASKAQAKVLEEELATFRAEKAESARRLEDRTRLLQEIAAQYPDAVRIGVGDGLESTSDQAETEPSVVVTLVLPKQINAKDKDKLGAWLNARLQPTPVELAVVEEPEPARLAARKPRR